MKFHIEIDCTPHEARTFLGLPNLEPLQEAMVQRMQERMDETMSMMDPEALMRTWFTGGPAMEAFQRMVQAGMGAPAQSSSPGADPTSST